MKAELVVADLAGAGIQNCWRQTGYVGEAKSLASPYPGSISTWRLGIDEARQDVLVAQPDSIYCAWPSMGWLVNLIGAKRVIVLERVTSVTRILNTGDVVIPSQALVLEGAEGLRVDSLISRSLYLDLVKATSGQIPSRVFHRSSYCTVAFQSGLEAYLLDQGYNLGFEIAGRGLNDVWKHVPRAVELASICLVEHLTGIEGKLSDVEPFRRTVCSVLRQLITPDNPPV